MITFILAILFCAFLYWLVNYLALPSIVRQITVVLIVVILLAVIASLFTGRNYIPGLG